MMPFEKVTEVPSFSFTGFTLVINLAEIVNPCLQLVIFSLLTMDYDGSFHFTSIRGIKANILYKVYSW